MEKIHRQENGFYMSETGNRWYQNFYGHTGYIRQAIRETKGVELGWQDGKANQAGSSNPGVWAFFPNGPDKELEKNVRARYWQIWTEHRTDVEEAKKNPQAKSLKPPPQPRVAKPKLVKRYEVYIKIKMAGKKEMVDERYPTYCFSSKMFPMQLGFSHSDAEDLYEKICKQKGINLYEEVGTAEMHDCAMWNIKCVQIKER